MRLQPRPKEDLMTTETVIQSGAVIEVPLNKLKKHPRNARKTPHADAHIEALAASMRFKGPLQPPVVEPERGADGEPTGFWLVSVGEGRRQAHLLRARRKEIRKTEPVRCIVDLANDAHEISLDENVTRAAMHPADEFEAFRRLAEEQGLGAEEIGARFGVSAHVVRQRLRLGAVSPRLMAIYRDGGLTLEQLMAFAVSEDHARQEQVYDQLSFSRSPGAIRRAMTEAKVPATDRRATFVGAEAYAEAGGTILRDLFTEDGGGWFEDAALLDRLVTERLQAVAAEVQAQEGWKWAMASLDYPHGHGLRRVYPRAVPRSAEDEAQIAALSEEYDALVSRWDAVEDLPPEVEARFKEIDAALDAFGDGTAYDPDEVARGGVFVILGHDGEARIERGLIRPEDEPPVEPEADADPVEDRDGGADDVEPRGAEEEEPDEDAAAPLSERLVLELTAYRTMGLRDAVAGDPILALTALAHALTLKTFYPTGPQASCVEVKLVSAYLDGHAPGVSDCPAGRRIAERHEAWAARLPREATGVWDWVSGLAAGELMDLLAHCVSLGINAVHNSLDRKPEAWNHADRLASAAGLDMRATWSPTAERYLSRVTKSRILDAVREAKGEDAAAQISGLKKSEMAQAAEQSLAGSGWLPPLLRTQPATPVAAELAA
jgi:ParB family chromosome partitioning protein